MGSVVNLPPNESCLVAFASARSEDRSGWTWGAGAEYAFTPNWSAFVEYNYYDFGRKLQNYAFSLSIPGVANFALPIPTQLSEQFHTIKAGVNYRFNWGAPLSPATEFHLH